MPARTLLGLCLLLGASPVARAADVMPIDQIRPGMEGVGRTVFEGTRVDEFGVRILGVLENVGGPRRSLPRGGRHAKNGPSGNGRVIRRRSSS